MIFPADFHTRVGFDLLKERLQNYCLCGLGLRLATSMNFSSEHQEVIKLLNRNHEFLQMLQNSEPYPSTNYFDPEEQLKMSAVVGHFLTPEDFLHIGQSMQTILEWKAFYNKAEGAYPFLASVANPVVVPVEVINSIVRVVDETGKVKDGASEELSMIRKKRRLAEDNVRKVMNTIFRKAQAMDIVPEGVQPSFRDGRVVVPVLAEYKKKLQGFVIDESSTGQTVFIEPVEMVDANNEIRDLQMQESRETIRILRELTGIVRANLPHLYACYQMLGIMDFNRAKAKLSSDVGGTLPVVENVPSLKWLNARNPQLFLTYQGKRDVATLNIDLTADQRFLLVSGPNAGGKSVCLKTVGLLQCMMQCGLLPPLHVDSTMGLFENIFLDIGDQQSIENDLSTYSSHLQNMALFIGKTDSRTLILIDELGSGTDPNFGGGIAEAVLTDLVNRNGWGVVTTHYYNLKTFAEQSPGIRNGAMMFDSKKLKPLYELEIGKPGSSYALEIARKSGLKEETLQRAERIIGVGLTGLETIMKNVTEEKQEVERLKRESIAKQRSLSWNLAKYEQLNTELELQKKQIVGKAKEEAAELLNETNKEIEKIIRHIRENKAERRETLKAREQLKELGKKVKTSLPALPQPRQFKQGESVKLPGQDLAGTVISVKGGLAVVQFGEMRTSVKISNLVEAGGIGLVADQLRTKGIDLNSIRTGFNGMLDVRGKRVDEVIPLLEKFIDNAILLGQGELKILHGKGEGVLREIIRGHLKKIKVVVSVRSEHMERGGDGISVVMLK